MFINVVFQTSRRVSIEFLRICSSLGHQLSPKILLKTQIRPDEISGLASFGIVPSTLKATGKFLSDGSKITTSLVLDFGIFARIVSERSPCGSIRPTHHHLRISSKIIVSKSVDFHIQVLPII